MKIAVVIALVFVAMAACSRQRAASGSLQGSSDTLAVSGSYTAIELDRVDRLSVKDAKLVIHGSTSSIAVDLPPSADPSKLDRHWALVTEADNGRTRALTFTHDESLDDFTIEVPAGDAPIRYGGFSGRDGNDVLVLAWGEGSRSFRAEVTVDRKPSTAPR